MATPPTLASNSQGVSFFDKLNYDVRSLVYEKMELPPLSHDYLGFVMSCRQAYQETEKAALTGLRHYIRWLKTRYQNSDYRLRRGDEDTLTIPEIPNDSNFAQLSEINIRGPILIVSTLDASEHFFDELCTRPFNKVTIVGYMAADETSLPQFKNSYTRGRYAKSIKRCIKRIFRFSPEWKINTVTIGWVLRDEGDVMLSPTLRGEFKGIVGSEFHPTRCDMYYLIHDEDFEVGEVGILSSKHWPVDAFVEFGYCHSRGIGENVQTGLAGWYPEDYGQIWQQTLEDCY